MTKRDCMLNHRFTRLVVTSEAGRSKSGELLWLCKCDCGNEVRVPGRALRDGITRSCGCLKRDVCAARHTKHNIYGYPLYKCWINMKGRCTCPTNKSYKYYGGRGITLCDEWMNDPLAFYNWALENGWRKGLTIERMDVDGPYSPDNCTWATRAQQSNNMRTNHQITYNGRTQNLSQWADELGIPRQRLSYRINKGWPIEKAFSDSKNLKS